MRERLTPALRAALESASEDCLIFDLDGIQARYRSLLRELPGFSVRFAIKGCPVDGVLSRLASSGSGFDAAGRDEIVSALRTGAPVERIHYGNTIKADADIAEAYALGIRRFATDSLQDVAAVAAHAPGAQVFCRLATSGEGALWGLSQKFGCSVDEAVRVLAKARDTGLVPSGLSVHVGSQQMRPEAWRAAAADIFDTIVQLRAHGIRLDHVNLGGGLPAGGLRDRSGQRLEPPLDKIFAVIRESAERLTEAAGSPLDFIIEPGRHLVAEQGAIRAHVARMASRQRGGKAEHWLYLSCGKFNGLYEMDQLQYPLVFPGHEDSDTVPAIVAGPTCDSDDAFASDGGVVAVPADLASGDPVWILSCGAYAVSYMTAGFNGFRPLSVTCLDAEG